MNVNVDKDSGFCFGVVYAIQMAESELDQGNELYCLGDIVHNNMEVDRLQKKGLKIIDHDQFRELHNCKVLIRAHGEPPETYQTAIRNNIELVDASCPVVLKLQNRVRSSFDSMEDDGQVVIYGKPGHAEVNGLVGQTRGEAIIITHEKDLEQIDFSRPIYLFSQTTKSTSGFRKMKEMIQVQVEEVHGKDAAHQFLNPNDTICRQVSNREPQLREFSKEHDVILFVSGRKSSNGKALYAVCQGINPNSHFISTIDEINPDWFSDSGSVGVCGATSTPMWLMEDVAETVRTMTHSPTTAHSK